MEAVGAGAALTGRGESPGESRGGGGELAIDREEEAGDVAGEEVTDLGLTLMLLAPVVGFVLVLVGPDAGPAPSLVARVIRFVAASRNT